MKIFGALVLILLSAAESWAAPGDAGPPVRIVEHNGALAFQTDGQARFPLFLFMQGIGDEAATAFRKAGFRFYSSIELTHFLDLGWVGDHQFDFSMIDKVCSGFAKRFPEGYYLMPRIHVFAPQWWLKEHPEEAVGLALTNGENTSQSLAKGESWASLRWREEAGEGLRRAVRHMLDAPYANRIMGIQVASGEGGEWLAWDGRQYPDTSKPMLEAFKTYVRKKYGSGEALRKAWGNPLITFDTITIPMVKERQAADVGLFRDPTKHRRLLDYYEVFHLTAVDAIDHFCRIIKKESHNRLLTCAMYAYQPDMPYVPSELSHRAPAAFLDLKSVDMTASPHSYWRRKPGQDATFRHFPESDALHHKLFIDEDDDRTHFAWDQSKPETRKLFMDSKTTFEDVNIIWRGFANVVTEGVGMWYMDQSSGRWYLHPELMKEFARVQHWADFAMTLPRQRRSQVAIISTADSPLHMGMNGQLDAQFDVAQIGHFCRAGAPFDRYIIQDLMAGRVPEYKVYVFLNLFHVTSERQAALDALKRNGHYLMFFFAPGFVRDSGLSVDGVSQAVGMTFTLGNKPFDTVKMDTNRFPKAPATFKAWRPFFGDIKKLSPRFVPHDASEVWGWYADSGEPAVAIKRHANWTSVYSGTVPLHWSVIQHILKEAKVHIYEADGDNLVASKCWVGIHAVTGGEKTICLPRPSPVYDVRNDKLLGKSLSQFTVPLKASETGLYVLAHPKKAM